MNIPAVNSNNSEIINQSHSESKVPGLAEGSGPNFHVENRAKQESQQSVNWLWLCDAFVSSTEAHSISIASCSV